LFVCGFSLGGLTAFHLAVKRPLDFLGAILLAPAIKEHPYFLRYSRYLTRIIARLFPLAPVTKANRKKSNAQRNLNVEEYLLKHDKLYYKGR
jgi:pimeloyl-ACP methyl ester carboxylesterase